MAWIIAYTLAKKVQRTAITIPLTTNLDFGGYRGINVGAPVDPNDAVRLPVGREHLEYPTEDVSFAYLASIGKLELQTLFPIGLAGVATIDTFADKRIEGVPSCGVSGSDIVIGIRIVDENNNYHAMLNATVATGDHQIRQLVAGTITSLATEAVDLEENKPYPLAFQVSGTTLSGFRGNVEIPVTATITATDTDLTSGRAGILPFRVGWALLKAPASPSPRPIAYFEVPIIGTGTVDDPFRPQMPEELTTHPELGTRNLLAMSHAPLIPVDRATGKPVHGTALVRIFEQPDRDPTLRDIPSCLDALRGMAGVTELTRDDALRRARALDDKLHLFDLVRIPTPVKDQIKEYIEWRRTIHKVEMSEMAAKRYLESDKGW